MAPPYHRPTPRAGDNQASVQNRLGYLYESVSGGIFMFVVPSCCPILTRARGLLSACGLFPDLRDGFYRDHADGLYSSAAFSLSYTLHALPTDMGSVALFSLFGSAVVLAPTSQHVMHARSFAVLGLHVSLLSILIYSYCTFLALHFGESLGLIFNVIFTNTVRAMGGMSVGSPNVSAEHRTERHGPCGLCGGGAGERLPSLHPDHAPIPCGSRVCAAFCVSPTSPHLTSPHLTSPHLTPQLRGHPQIPL